MKRRGKLAALVLTGLMAISVLSACAPNTSTQPTTTGSSETQATTETTKADTSFQKNEDGSFVSGGIKFPLEEKVTYSFFRTSDAKTLEVNGGDIGNNEFWIELEKLTNVHFEFITPAIGTEREQYNLQITSGNLPDVMSNPDYYRDGLDNGIDDGYFLDLTDLIPDYAPEYLKVLEASGQAKNVKTDTNRFASMAMIFKEVQAPFAGFIIRKDWLDELKLEVPVTYADWETVLTAFKDEKGCTTPLVLTKFGYWNLGIGMGAIGDGTGATTYQVDGKIKDSLLDTPDASKEYFMLMNRWYTNGLLDQNFMSTTGYLPDPSFVNTGAAGITQAMYSQISTAYAPTKQAGGELVALPWVVKNKGDVLHTNPLANPSKVTPSVTISTSCEQPETLLAMFNYLFTEDGFVLENYGIEGVTYNLDSAGNIKYSDAFLKDIAAGIRKYTMPPSWGPSWVDADRQNPALPQTSIDMMKVWTTDLSYKLPTLTMTAEESAEYADLMADLSTHIEENCLQFITGAKSFDQWDTFIASLEEMGLRRCNEIQQQALDRYNKR